MVCSFLSPWLLWKYWLDFYYEMWNTDFGTKFQVFWPLLNKIETYFIKLPCFYFLVQEIRNRKLYKDQVLNENELQFYVTSIFNIGILGIIYDPCHAIISKIYFNTNVFIPLQAFSVFFVCIAVTSDVVCYLFIPVQWLFFAASTYVWVQYVWHTGN